MHIRLSRRAIACALLATTCLSTPAMAQDAGADTMPRNRQELDENGVNWATGEQVNYHTDVSVGSMRYVRAQGWGIDTSNYSMSMVGSVGVGFTVVVGLRAITFNYVGGQYVPDDGCCRRSPLAGSGWSASPASTPPSTRAIRSPAPARRHRAGRPRPTTRQEASRIRPAITGATAQAPTSSQSSGRLLQPPTSSSTSTPINA
jgi:hypothetical protein